MASLASVHAVHAKPFTTTRPKLVSKLTVPQNHAMLFVGSHARRVVTVNIGTPGGGGGVGPGTMPPGGGGAPGGGNPGGEFTTV